jgi:hypothetical protein
MVWMRGDLCRKTGKGVVIFPLALGGVLLGTANRNAQNAVALSRPMSNGAGKWLRQRNQLFRQNKFRWDRVEERGPNCA